MCCKHFHLTAIQALKTLSYRSPHVHSSTECDCCCRTTRKQELTSRSVLCGTCDDCVFLPLNYIAQSNSSVRGQGLSRTRFLCQSINQKRFSLPVTAHPYHLWHTQMAKKYLQPPQKSTTTSQTLVPGCMCALRKLQTLFMNIWIQ